MKNKDKIIVIILFIVLIVLFIILIKPENKLKTFCYNNYKIETFKQLVKESNKAEMQAIGAGALNQAVKAVAIARGFVAPAGVDLICIPAFAEVEVEGEERTGIKLIVESRK